MKILTTMWAVQRNGHTIGMVVTENETTGERKIRMGTLTPIESVATEDESAKMIAERGSTVSTVLLKQLITEVEAGK